MVSYSPGATSMLLGVFPQFVGQVDSTSTRVKPLPSICSWKAFFIAFFACNDMLYVMY